MKISFDKVIPKPLENESFAANSVWNSSFELNAGSSYLLNASSGKGKSTFSNIIYGLRHDFTGKLRFDENDTTTINISKWAEIRSTEISMVFQNLDLFPNLTAFENIQIKNELTHRKTKSEIEHMLEILGIKAQKDKKVSHLSMGQKQRVAIIRSLCQPFKWLLLDEPFSHLDQNNIQLAMTLISKEVQNNEAGMILTSLGPDYGMINYTDLEL